MGGKGLFIIGQYLKVNVDVTTGSWFNIDKYFTQQGSIFLHWGNIILIVSETRRRRVAMNFGWSLKPVFILFAATFGIDLDRPKKKSTIKLCLITFFYVSWLAFVIIPLNLRIIVEGTNIVKNSSAYKSVVQNVNVAISWIIPGILNMLLLVTIVYSSFGKWKSLWERLQRLQDDIGENPALFQQLRQHANQGLLIFFLVKATPL